LPGHISEQTGVALTVENHGEDHLAQIGSMILRVAVPPRLSPPAPVKARLV
jgi:hypothetical protein